MIDSQKSTKGTQKNDVNKRPSRVAEQIAPDLTINDGVARTPIKSLQRGDWLHDGRLHMVQRQQLAQGIGQIQGNRHLQRLVNYSITSLTKEGHIQRNSESPSSARDQFPWSGDIHRTTNAALRKAPHKDPENPHANTLADLPQGTVVWVTGITRGWLHVEVFVKGKQLKGYVSQELVKYVKGDEFVIGDLEVDQERITVARAFVILKRAETIKASDPTYQPDEELADKIGTSIWVLEGSGKWIVDPKTYRVTLKQKGDEKIKLHTIEDFILFVEAVERQYPAASPQDIASEIRQMWFSGDTWEAMLDSRGVRTNGKAEDIESQSNPIAKKFDMDHLRTTGGRSKVIETPLGKVDIAHVMTGIDGALSNSPKGDGFKTKELRQANRGDPRDFVTWSGDLGQAYAHYLLARWKKGDKSATLAEFVEAEAGQEALLGDIHGYIAKRVFLNVPREANPTGNKLKVSNILRTLYLVDKEKAGIKNRSYFDYMEQASGQKREDLREFIVERSLKFAPFEYAKEVAGEWGLGKKVWEGITSSKKEVLGDQKDDFNEQHQKNEGQATEEDKLGGLVDKFMDMLNQEMP